MLTVGFGIITLVFLIFGVGGYAAFGEGTEDLITRNLPDDWTTAAVKLALCTALFFTFPVMMVPVYEVLERHLERLDVFQRAVAPGRRCRRPRLPCLCGRRHRPPLIPDNLRRLPLTLPPPIF